MSHFGRSGPPDISGTHSLLVLNISFRTTADDLMPLFEKYGKVVDIFIPRDRRKGTSRGFAFVRYKYEDEAEKAIKRVDGKHLDGRDLVVQWAKYGRNEDEWGSGGRSRGRDRYDDDRRDRRRERDPDDRDRRRSRSGSRTPPRRRRARSESDSPVRRRARSDSRSPVRRRSPSRSPARKRSLSRSASPAPRRGARSPSPRKRSVSPKKRSPSPPPARDISPRRSVSPRKSPVKSDED